MKVLTITILLLTLCVPLHGQGKLIHDPFFSSSLNEMGGLVVHLPESYDPNDTSTRYPVVYFLHPAQSNEDTWSSAVKNALDKLIADKIVKPMIVMKPYGNFSFSFPHPWRDSFFTNSELHGLYEDFIVSDLVTYVDSHYNTLASRDQRAIMGHSLGGYGALKLGFKHPDIYRGVASLDGPVLLTSNLVSIADCILTTEYSGAGPFDPRDGICTQIMFAQAGAFSPNLNTPPYFVDLPIDTDFTFIDSVMAKWRLHNIPDVASQYSPDSELAIYMNSGDTSTTNYLDITILMDSLDVMGIPYTFYRYDGGHSVKMEERISLSLTFLDSVMRKRVTGISADDSHVPSEIALSQNYPNPFNPTTTIKYDLSRSSQVGLRIYSLLGEEIRTLVNTVQSAGERLAVWDGRDRFGQLVASGVYVYRLQAGDDVASRKMILIK